MVTQVEPAMKSSTEVWAWEQFGSVRTGDARRSKRLLNLARQAADAPDGRIASVCSDRRDREGAYDLLESRRIEPKDLMRSIAAATARRCNDEQLVYVAVDGSSLTVGGRCRGEAFGAIGSHGQGARGLKVMSALVVSVTGTTVGLVDQVWWTRPQRQRLDDCRRRKLCDKESRRWLEVMERSRHAIAAQAPNTTACFLLDREADNQAVLSYAVANQVPLIVRAYHNRRLMGQQQRAKRWRSGGAPLLFDTVMKRRVAGNHRVWVPPKDGKPGRVAVLQVRFMNARLLLQDRRSSKVQEPIEMHVVDAREKHPPLGKEPLAWTLLTTQRVRTVHEARAVVSAYCHRWQIEQFHRTWKSGACNVERSQLRTVQAMTVWATILATVAARIERIKHLSREQPGSSARDEFSAEELEALRIMRQHQRPDEPIPEVDEMTMGMVAYLLADLGGYVQSSAKRPPGSVVLGRGLVRLQLYAEAIAAAQRRGAN